MEDFEKLFSCYYGTVYNFLLKMTNYHEDLAAELTQDTFYNAYLAIGDFKGSCKPETWLIAIAKNRFYMFLRNKKKADLSFEEISGDTADTDTLSPQDETVKRQVLFHARKVIDSMEPKMRDVMIYRIYSDMPYAQIGRLLSIKENSAKVIFFRGKEILRKRLKEDYGYEI